MNKTRGTISSIDGKRSVTVEEFDRIADSGSDEIDQFIDWNKARARRHHRSLQKEVQVPLGDAASMSPHSENEPHLKLHLAESGSDARWTREEIYESQGR